MTQSKKFLTIATFGMLGLMAIPQSAFANSYDFQNWSINSATKFGCLDMRPSMRVGSGFDVNSTANCHGRSNQRWTASSDTIFTIHQGRKYCLSAASGNNQNVSAQPCNGSASQKWDWSSTYNVNGTTIKSPEGRCLDQVGNGSGSYRNIVTYNCHDGPNQKWRTDWRHMKVGSRFACLDVSPSSPVSNGFAVTHYYKCHNGNNQKWRSVGETLQINWENRAYCLSAPAGNNQAVSAQRCNGSTEQKWSWKLDGTIRSANGMCLDAVSTSDNSGRIVSYSCHSGPNQKWGDVPYTDRGAFYKSAKKTFTCKQAVQARLDGCSVPKKWEEKFTVPDNVPAFLMIAGDSVLDNVFDDDDYSKFRSACDHHDACYNSPWHRTNGGRNQCDDQFEEHLLWKCDKVHDDGSPNWAACKVTAYSVAGFVREFGDTPFKHGQEWSRLNCSPD